MDFGKVPINQLTRIDLGLPDDDPRTWTALRRDGELAANKMTLRVGVGCPVWAVKAWVGKVYPEGTQTKDFLKRYAEQFNSIELNTTHYRTPTPETVTAWREATPEGFKFNVKFLQEISHRRPLSGHLQLVNEFVQNINGLGNRLGISFLQLPPSFAPMDLPELAKFLKQLPADFQIAVEVRHPAFFHDHRLSDAYYETLAEHGAHVVITDVAGRRDVLHTSLTSRKVLVRFIGNELHPSDTTRTDLWIERIATWLKLGLDQIEFFIHQPGDIVAPELVSSFIERLNSRCELTVKNWRPMKQGEQLGFF